MEAYGGFDPQVGEIRALRTFRIGPGGILYPLFGDRAWTPGTNTSFCRVQQGADSDEAGRARHIPPDPECSCGFYAYADDGSAAEYPHSQHVLAVIAGWGRVVAGTRGIRAQYARIEALWMSSRVPPDLQAGVAAQYPDVVVYATKQGMFREQPPTLLDCYEIPTPRQRALRKRALQAVMATALVVGSLPAHWIWNHQDARLIWGSELVAFLVASWFFRISRQDRQARGYAVLCVAVTLWLVAPFAGAAGILLLRLPLLQIAFLGRLHRARLNREAGRFPAAIDLT